MATADMPTIVTRRLTKDYGGGRGLNDLDLEVGAGEVFGFLGPNGAGKTTTIRLLMGMIRPSGGSARVFGLDCQREAVAVKRLVGYVPGELPDWGRLRGSEITASLAGLRGGVDPAHVARLCEQLELDLGRHWRELSRGNKQKLALVLALMHRPELLVLDEPTGGLDPLKQQVFYRLLAEARAGGATVFCPPMSWPRSSMSATGSGSSGRDGWSPWPPWRSYAVSAATRSRSGSPAPRPSRRSRPPPASPR
jgi:ABC-2 type transport system ATP-binding protein